MRVRALIILLSALAMACGGGDDADDTTTVVNDTGDTGDEAPPPDDEPDDVGDPGDPEPEEDEGNPCYPVSRCHSFANQDCAPIDAEGAIEGDQFSGGRIREACPGERGVSEAIRECFSYVEISEGCPRRMPDLGEPAWPCGRNDDGTCGVQM